MKRQTPHTLYGQIRSDAGLFLFDLFRYKCYYINGYS
nr:MAG TPA: hypothetical protein [Caudoviricetes sp.]